MIKLFLDGCELRQSFKLSDLSICRFYSLINHKSHDGNTPLEWLLHNAGDKLKDIFQLFLECDECEIEEALKICKEKKFIDYDLQLTQRIYKDLF